MSDLEDPREPSPEDILRVHLITLMRIYDVQLAILKHLDPKKADIVVQQHEKFDYIGPLPFMEE